MVTTTLLPIVLPGPLRSRFMVSTNHGAKAARLALPAAYRLRAGLQIKLAYHLVPTGSLRNVHKLSGTLSPSTMFEHWSAKLY